MIYFTNIGQVFNDLGLGRGRGGERNLDKI
jgi:hypothetical protein